MLVNSKELLIKAYKDGYAIGAYNINNLEFTKYILEACQEDMAPVILAVSESAAKYMGGYKTVANMVKGLIEDLKVRVPVVLHLDHAKSFEACKEAIDMGFTSVMIDGSLKSIEDNIEITSRVKEYANPRSVSVEAEIGVIGENYTNADICSDFISQTRIDSLAPSVGNKHGIYDKAPEIDFELLGEISKTTKLPLVLHGASGLDNNKLKTAIFCGVTKINFNTDIQVIWSKDVRKFMDNNKDIYDPRKVFESSKESIKKYIHEKNEILGSKNRAI